MHKYKSKRGGGKNKRLTVKRAGTEHLYRAFFGVYRNSYKWIE